MGYLDKTTITVDAILTKKGRRNALIKISRIQKILI